MVDAIASRNALVSKDGKESHVLNQFATTSVLVMVFVLLLVNADVMPTMLVLTALVLWTLSHVLLTETVSLLVTN